MFATSDNSYNIIWANTRRYIVNDNVIYCALLYTMTTARVFTAIERVSVSRAPVSLAKTMHLLCPRRLRTPVPPGPSADAAYINNRTRVNRAAGGWARRRYCFARYAIYYILYCMRVLRLRRRIRYDGGRA